MEHPTSTPLKSVNSLSAWFTNTLLPLANSLALLSMPLAGFDSGSASCHARQQPGVVINAIGGHSGPALPMQINSMPLADIDSGSASFHARQ